MRNLRRQFERQLAFLELSCKSFDAGWRDEAVRIAVSLRVLFHDTGRSTSLLMHMREKPLNLLTTVPVDAHRGKAIVADRITVWTAQGPTAGLGSRPNAIEMSFDEWWNQIIYIVARQPITRRDLILTAANKDGGAHVDTSLTPEYETLSRMWTRVSLGSDEPPVPIDDIHLLGLRQIAYEVLHSPQILRLRNNPTGVVDEVFLRNQAAHFVETGDHDTARSLLQIALTTVPECAETHRDLGVVLSLKGELEPARDHFTTAVSLSPEDRTARRGLAAVLGKLGFTDEAEAQYREGLTIDPTDAYLLYGLSVIYLERGDPTRALETCYKALEHLPDAAVLHDWAGVCLLRLGNAAAALAHFNRNLATNPDHPRPRINRACALTALGRLDEAMDDVTAAVSLSPETISLVEQDDDLAPLRSHAQYRALLHLPDA